MTQIFTVSELNNRIRDRLQGDLRLCEMWAKGELTNVTLARSGHQYFSLRDATSQISCVIFRSDAQNLKLQLKEGANVLVYGDIDFYRPRGDVQIRAKAITLDIGIGQRLMELEALKKRLSDEGLFAEERKRVLPPYPERIGIVTSPSGAALRDVVRIIGSYPAKIIISPALVQGEGSAKSISDAIVALRGMADVVIVCRGGGSSEDLMAFNSEQVARAINDCDVPVISAVGHETDVTIADYVADIRAPTPTAAAQLAVPEFDGLMLNLQEARRRMERAFSSQLDRIASRLDYLERRLSARRMYALVSEQRLRLDLLSERLVHSESEIVRQQRQRLEVACGRLSANSPLAILSRGYCIAMDQKGGVIMRSSDAMPGEKIRLLLSDGFIKCQVLEDEAKGA